MPDCMIPLVSLGTVVAHQSAVHQSVVVGGLLVVEVVVVVVVVVMVGISGHDSDLSDSSPMAAKANLCSVRSLALSSSAVPVGYWPLQFTLGLLK